MFFYCIYSSETPQLAKHPSVTTLLTAVNRIDLSSIKSIPELNVIMQSLWIRKPNQERADLQDGVQEKRLRPFVLFHMHRLGMMKIVYPTEKIHYDYVVLHGAMINTMIKRIHFLRKIFSRLCNTQIVFLSGKRLLDPDRERTYLLKGLQTEKDAAEYLMRQYNFSNVLFINATNFKGIRPNTKDTVDAWMLMNPKPGRILAISNQPYIQRQDWILRDAMPQDFSLETVGPGADSDIQTKVLFDELARLVYTQTSRTLQGKHEK